MLVLPLIGKGITVLRGASRAVSSQFVKSFESLLNLLFVDAIYRLALCCDFTPFEPFMSILQRWFIGLYGVALIEKIAK